MNKQIRIIAFISLLMIVSLMVSTTILQFFSAKKLNGNAWNSRTIYKEYGKKRGSILVEGEPIVYSKKTDDRFNFQRVYKDSQIYSPVTGFYSIANRADRGIEAAMNDELTGDTAVAAWKNFTDFLMNKEKSGVNVNLTLSSVAQTEAMHQLEGVNGAIVAVEPQTGRILALASSPSIDANSFAVHDTQKASQAYQDAAEDDGSGSPLINKATFEPYPPGSTFKILTSATALENGYKSDTLINSPKDYTLPGTTTKLPNFHDGNCRSSGKETLKEALVVSCNTAFAMLGNELGKKKMQIQAEKFGMGTSFVLAGKKAAMPFKTNSSTFPNNPTPDRLALDSIGQGDVAITPLQDALFSASIANDGVLMSPYLVDSLSDENGVIEKFMPQKFSDAISKSTASQLNDMMQATVNQSVSLAKVSGVKVAGKSGTAQNDLDKPSHAWFSGFAPADDPKIAICVFVQNGGFGFEESAPKASKVIQAYLDSLS